MRAVKAPGSERRISLSAVALLVAVFVALYPYLDLAGYCDDGGCPDVTQISASASPDLPSTGVLSEAVAPIAAVAMAAGLILLLSERRPDELLLSPESPPPRL
ncbi:hypothetical protein BH20ACT11_BH20ACT11_05600 [soil metagenome]|jgi:hypothetical protein